MRWNFPALPSAVAGTASAVWGVTITADPGAPAPQSLPAFAVLFAHARSEQVVRAIARRTNLVLPAATVLVVGDGPIAEALTTTLTRGGSRIVRAAGEPVARLRAGLAGLRTVPPSAPWPAADHVIATGEGHAPVDPSVLRGVLIDASPDGTGLIAAGGRQVRPFVHRTAARTWVVDAPAVFDAGPTASPPSTRIADLLIALSILRVRTNDADARLARLVVA